MGSTGDIQGLMGREDRFYLIGIVKLKEFTY